jgi:hypothetical protein
MFHSRIFDGVRDTLGWHNFQGPMTGYKVVLCKTLGRGGIEDQNVCLMKIETAPNARIIKPRNTNKLRCSGAFARKTKPIRDYDKYNAVLKTFSWHKWASQKSEVLYEEGDLILPDEFDDDPKHECTNGIHFFRTKEEAKIFAAEYVMGIEKNN